VPTSPPYADIFQRLLEGRVSPAEAEALIEWLSRDQQDPEAKARILAQLQWVVAGDRISDDIQSKMEARLPAILGNDDRAESSVIRTRRTPVFPLVRYSSVAAVLLLIGAGIYLFPHHQKPAIPAVSRTARFKKDIPPGRQGAILTLADGRTVVLDSLGNGVVAIQAGTKITLNNGGLAYNAETIERPSTDAAGSATGATASSDIVYNTMTTPKGRQFQVTLPDGTRVWLNAASSLRYPTAFTGKERKVMVTGEAYFEVVRDATHPFLVQVNPTTTVEVLGTHFNINAYSDEASISTTLLEGSVRIHSGNEKAVLEPGQQAQVGEQTQVGQSPGTGSSVSIKIIAKANLEKVMAWKNGVFDFQDATLEEVMRQLQRWYDIDVVYEKGIPKIEFIGKMGRDLSFSEVLGGLQLSKVHFRLEDGRKLVVLP
jgi:ferric-dicitrate binding protein FerR (iron transport regulator)